MMVYMVPYTRVCDVDINTANIWKRSQMEEVTDGFLEVLGKNGYILIFFFKCVFEDGKGTEKG